jgi:hypothetical protein
MTQIVEVGRRVLAPFCSLGRWYNETAKRHPVATGVWTSGLKTSAADAFAQKVLEGREEMDWKRHATFCTFGFVYLGGFQYWLYNVKFTQWCGPITSRFGHKASAPIKTFIDQAIHHPFVYFPTFYAIKASVTGKPMSYAVDKYKSEIWTSMKTLWTVWVPLQLINFAFVPRHLRVPYVAGVSFGWTMILSVMQGKFDKTAEVSESKLLSDSVRETVRMRDRLSNSPACAHSLTRSLINQSPTHPLARSCHRCLRSAARRTCPCPRPLWRRPRTSRANSLALLILLEKSCKGPWPRRENECIFRTRFFIIARTQGESSNIREGEWHEGKTRVRGPGPRRENDDDGPVTYGWSTEDSCVHCASGRALRTGRHRAGNSAVPPPADSHRRHSPGLPAVLRGVQGM